MKNSNSKRLIKTFPIELDIDLHKALKMMAIESDMTLHAFITNLLTSVVSEYQTKSAQASKLNRGRILLK